MNQQAIQSYKKAGNIASQVVNYAKQIIKPGMLLLEIAEKIENKILSLGGKLAFPVSLSINEVAAHYTPSYNDQTLATGLLKVDIGVQINGYIADTAFSINLEKPNSKQYKQNKSLIQAAEQALSSAIKLIKENPKTELSKIGATIQQTITSFNFSPIRNLCGHELGHYLVHAGLTIPNVDNNSNIKLFPGAYAIEPFSTTGTGIVYEAGPSGIYKLNNFSRPRDSLSREILSYIQENYETLPFSKREIIKKFSQRALFSLKILENQGIIKQYPQLIEKLKKPVAQAEHTILISDVSSSQKQEVEITTK